MQSNNTRYYLVTLTFRDNTSLKWFTHTTRILHEDQVENAIDTYHAKQLHKNCSLEALRVTSCDDPRFPSVWQKLVDDRELTYKSKFHVLNSEFKGNLHVDNRLQSEAFQERRQEALILHAQRLSEARAIMDAKKHVEWEA